LRLPPLAGGRGKSRQNVRQRPAKHVLQRAGEQNDEALDNHDHVPADLGLVERQLRAALLKHAEQDRRQNDASRMSAAHQRHRDANKTETADIFENEAMLFAKNDVDG
jgi:hypothetical protein